MVRPAVGARLRRGLQRVAGCRACTRESSSYLLSLCWWSHFESSQVRHALCTTGLLTVGSDASESGSVAFSFGQGDMTRWQRLDGAVRRCSFFTLLLLVGLQVTAGRCCPQLTMSYGTVRRAREASDGRDMANQFLEWLWRVLAAVCALGEREEGEGICFCVDREGRGQEHMAGQWK